MENFKVIDCGNYIYISKDNGRYSSNTLSRYRFDGCEAEETKKSGWYKLAAIPKSVTEKQPNKRINERYELKSGYKSSDIMPSIITMDMNSSDEYEEVMGLYSYKYDEIDGGYEEIEFKIEKIYERKDFEFVPNQWNAQSDLLTQIEYEDVVYQDKPCKLDSSQMLKIIRDYIRRNIDSSVAKITSDYDFHLEVVKQIDLAEPYSHMVDTNNSFLNKRRKPKWVSKMVSDKKVTVLNLKDKSSSNNYGDDCKLAPCITGDNYEDLNKKVTAYLDEMMAMINKHYCECPTCKGWGVVEE